jgi:endonuclease YncB( thermonuclease family)
VHNEPKQQLCQGSKKECEKVYYISFVNIYTVSMKKAFYVLGGLLMFVGIANMSNEEQKEGVEHEVTYPSLEENSVSESTVEEVLTSAVLENQLEVETKDVSEEKLEVGSPLSLEGLYDVVKVIDGDTLSVDLHGTVTTLRLIGIDTPETVDPRKTVECFGKEASDKAKELLSGNKVRIEHDSSQGELDKYGRLLAYVYLEDGLFFNKFMIEEGYAHEYTYNIPYKYQTEFKDAELDAQKNNKGLWAPNMCESFDVPVTAVTSTQNDATKETPLSQKTYGEYVCTGNTYNCGDFATHAEAQSVYEACGGVQNDIHELDRDKDGEACESLP